MAETPRNDQAREAADLVGAARDRGLEQLEGAKAQLAEGAERVAAAVERTADELEGEGDGTLSGFGQSMASVMRQLAGGLRERDVEAFARELGAFARHKPGVFLAGSVALGFGVARFFKAHAPSTSRDYGWQDAGGRRSSGDGTPAARKEVDAEESLDLSAGSPNDSGPASRTAAPDADRNEPKSRQPAEHKAKQQRVSSGSSQQAGSQAPSSDQSRPDTSPTAESSRPGGSAFTGNKGGGAPRGGKS